MARSQISDRLPGCVTAIWATPLILFALVVLAVPLYQAYRYHLVKWQVAGFLRDMDPVIDDLELYHRQYGYYPKSLNQLSVYIPSLPRPPFRDLYRNGRGCDYHLQDGSYELRATIVGKNEGFMYYMEWLSYSPDRYHPLPGVERPYARIGRWAYCTVWD